MAASSRHDSHGSQRPCTVSDQRLNEPRGVRRAPRGPTLRIFSGLPPQRTFSICSVRSNSSQPLPAGLKLRASTPAHLPSALWISGGQSSRAQRCTILSLCCGKVATIAAASSGARSPWHCSLPCWASTRACAPKASASAVAWRGSTLARSSSTSSAAVICSQTAAVVARCALWARLSSTCAVDASTCASTSQAMRTAYGTWRALPWWQASMPHRRSLIRIEMLIDAATPMFCRYSTCTGDTLRSTPWLMSSAAPAALPNMGTAA